MKGTDVNVPEVVEYSTEITYAPLAVSWGKAMTDGIGEITR